MKLGFLKFLAIGSTILVALCLLPLAAAEQEDNLDQEAGELLDLIAPDSHSNGELIYASEEERKLAAQEAEILKKVGSRGKESVQQRGPAPVKQAKVAGVGSAPSVSSETNRELEQRLFASQDRVTQLLQALDEARRRLMLAETEVERLSGIIEGRPRQIAQSRQPRPRATPAVPIRTERAKPLPAIAHSPTPAAVVGSSEMPIATVSVDKANLRTGPGLEHSPLMSVSEGVRLAVETRKGDWYRVMAPTGVRAWISASVVDFSPETQWQPAQTARIAEVSIENLANNMQRSADTHRIADQPQHNIAVDSRPLPTKAPVQYEEDELEDAAFVFIKGRK